MEEEEEEEEEEEDGRGGWKRVAAANSVPLLAQDCDLDYSPSE
jgi:hypothetical protein